MSNNKQSMKLYTERQMKEMFRMGLAQSINEDGALYQFAAIEPPSDEEIYINANVNSENIEHNLGFIKCIQVMRELIEKNKV